MSKGLTIKVLSGSVSDGALALPKVEFIKLTTALHNNEEEKLKVVTDLWQNAQPTTKLPKESQTNDKGVSKDTDKSAVSRQDKG